MLKKQATFLILAVLVAFPALGWAQVADINNYSAGNVSTSIQGYGEQTADYQAGCVRTSSYEKGTIEKVEVVTTGTYTSLGSQTSVPCSSCGIDLTQGRFEGDTTTTRTNTEYTAATQGTYLVGSSKMNSLGGLSLCSTAGISAEGSLSQAQTVNQTASGSIGPGITGTASYTGTQSFTANIKSQ